MIYKTLAELIDELSVTNIKIFWLIEKVQNNKANMEDAKKVQVLNVHRSKIMNAISEHFNEEVRIKV